MTKEEKKNRVFFDSGIYSPEAVKMAAAVFAGRLAISFKKTAQGASAGFNAGTADSAALTGEFLNEVLNQQCRLDLERKNSRLAGIVFTKALLSAGGEKIRARGRK